MLIVSQSFPRPALVPQLLAAEFFASLGFPLGAVIPLGLTVFDPGRIEIGWTIALLDGFAGDEADEGYQVPPAVLGGPVTIFQDSFRVFTVRE